MTTALYDAGFGSSSRLYERAPSQLGMTPATYSQGGAGMQINYTVVSSPLGRLLVGATTRGISALIWARTTRPWKPRCKKNSPARKSAGIVMGWRAGSARYSSTCAGASRISICPRTCKPPPFSAAYGKNCGRFRMVPRAPTAKWPRLSESHAPFEL